MIDCVECWGKCIEFPPIYEENGRGFCIQGFETESKIISQSIQPGQLRPLEECSGPFKDWNEYLKYSRKRDKPSPRKPLKPPRNALEGLEV